MFKVLVTTKFRNRIVNYAQTVRELVGTVREVRKLCATYAKSIRELVVPALVNVWISACFAARNLGLFGVFSRVDWTSRWEVMTENVFNGSFQIKEVKLGHTGSG